MAIAQVYRDAAVLLGWRWSQVHNGLINEAKMRPVYDRQHEGGYEVAFDSEDACYLSGVETEKDALTLVQNNQQLDNL